MIYFLILCLSAIVSTFLTYYLNIHYKQGPVRASSILALLVGGFFYFFPDLFPEAYTKNIPLYVIGGSFIGMVSSTIQISNISLLLSPIIFSLLTHYTSKMFINYGGALGTTACISLLSTMAFPIITKNKKVTYGYRLIRVLIKRKMRK